jgi:phosphohistidine phosphatase
MAQWLKPRLPKDLRIVVSPARRAQQTAAALTDDYETRDEIAVGADAADAIRIAGWPDAKRAVMLVGHQPTLGEVAAELLAGRHASWRVAKGSVWWIQSRRRGGRLEAILKLAIEPDAI